VTVLDTSGALDYLLATGAAEHVGELFHGDGTLAAPDVLTFEVLAVLRREVLRGTLGERRAAGAVEDYADLAVTLFPATPVRMRAWALRDRLTAADALFVALAESLDEPLATKDTGLSRTAEALGLSVVRLTA
jgi:predicted nucleic acid-binding protein